MKNKNWFITGISGGLGKALALQVIEQGDFVIGTFRNREAADQFNKEYASRGFAIVMDLNKEDQIREAVQQTIDRFGSIDVLVNNAGSGLTGAIEETSITEARTLFDTVFFGPLLLTQAFLPFFRNRRSGHIVQISSHGGIKAFAGFGIYNAAKFALEGCSEALAQELAPLGISVTLVEPGPFRTGFAGNALVSAERIIDDYKASSGAFRDRIKAVDGRQEGDPVKAAAAIRALVQMPHPPLRLPLGKIAVGTIASKIASIQADLDAGREIAERAVYE